LGNDKSLKGEIRMDTAAGEKKPFYPSLTSPKITIAYGDEDITGIVKSIILHDIENSGGEINAENR
jgi:hypothetical protein